MTDHHEDHHHYTNGGIDADQQHRFEQLRSRSSLRAGRPHRNAVAEAWMARVQQLVEERHMLGIEDSEPWLSSPYLSSPDQIVVDDPVTVPQLRRGDGDGDTPHGWFATTAEDHDEVPDTVDPAASKSNLTCEMKTWAPATQQAMLWYLTALSPADQSRITRLVMFCSARSQSMPELSHNDDARQQWQATSAAYAASAVILQSPCKELAADFHNLRPAIEGWRRELVRDNLAGLRETETVRAHCQAALADFDSAAAAFRQLRVKYGFPLDPIAA